MSLLPLTIVEITKDTPNFGRSLLLMDANRICLILGCYWADVHLEDLVNVLSIAFSTSEGAA